MVTAFGLALQGLGMTPINANLMPSTLVRETVWKRKTAWFVAAAAIGILGAGTSFLRPFLDSQGKQDIGNDPVIRSVVAKGQQLKQEWQQISTEFQPKFRADNIKQLLQRRDLYFMLLEDVNQMLADADAKAKASGEGTGRAFDVFALDTSYIPPGQPLPVFASPEAASVGGGGGGGGAMGVMGGGGPRGSMDGSEEGGATPGAPGTAGEFGALEVTLSLTSADDGGKVFFNDTILEWLRKGVDQTTRPYSILQAPTIAQVEQAEVTGEVFRPSKNAPGMPGGGAGGSVFGTGGSRVLGGGGGGDRGSRSGLGGGLSSPGATGGNRG
jgi:hypothetical protein